MLRTLQSLAIACLLTTFAAAQNLKADRSTVSSGDTVYFEYTGGSPNQSINVKLTNGDPLDPQEETITVETDANGTANFSWSAAEGWDAAFVEADGRVTPSRS